MLREESPKECVFCGKQRIKNGEILWQSSIRIETDYVIKDKILSVCPDCRKKHSIQHLYVKVLALLIEDAKEILAMEEEPEENLPLVGSDLDSEKEPKRPYRSPLW